MKYKIGRFCSQHNRAVFLPIFALALLPVGIGLLIVFMGGELTKIGIFLMGFGILLYIIGGILNHFTAKYEGTLTMHELLNKREGK